MNLAIWGDSITYGECDSEGLGWVGRLRKLGEGNINVYNRGICGDTSVDLVKRFSIEAESIQPEKIVFAIGINDSKYSAGETKNKVSLQDFKKNMHLLIDEAQKFTKNVYIVSATKVDDEFTRSSGTRFINRDIQLYNAALKEVAEEKDLKFIDIFDVLDPTTDLEDGLHPNASGYEKLFQLIAPKLK